MGGDTYLPYDLEGESSLEQGFTRLLSSSSLISDDLSMKVEDEAKNGHNNLVFVESNEEGLKHSAAASLEMEFDCRKRLNVYREIMQSYDKLCLRHESLSIAKTKILSYTPGAWVEKVGGMKLSHYDVPKTTSLLLIGPKGSGKSSLVNRISKVFEDDMFASDRAQVSYNSSSLDGTYFLKEYMIPRGSTSFCLYDTRSLGYSSSDNMNMVKHWITKGVRHGEVAVWYDLLTLTSSFLQGHGLYPDYFCFCDLLISKSDSPILRDGLQCKARRYNCRSSEIRMVNFVIFVVNGLEILKSLDSNGGGETCYTQMIASAFNCPYLSFRDDKPAVVFTHGDLLSLDDRVRIRIHLGELLGIPPAKQIFDIPESCDPGTELTILDMLRYSLEHADSNLPPKGCIMNKVHRQSRKAFLFLLIILWFAILSGFIQVYKHKSYKSDHVDWHAIRHLWSE